MPDNSEEYSPKCPTCERLAGHHPAIRVIEYATEQRRLFPEAYIVVDDIKKRWKERQ